MSEELWKIQKKNERKIACLTSATCAALWKFSNSFIFEEAFFVSYIFFNQINVIWEVDFAINNILFASILTEVESLQQGRIAAEKI